MTTFYLYVGMLGDKNEIMAVNATLIDDGDNPADFFLSDTVAIARVGKIEVEGDDHLLADYFSVL